MTPDLQLWGIRGLPEIRTGDRLGDLIAAALSRQGLTLAADDVLVITQKIVSKAEGRVVDLASVTPSAFAQAIAGEFGKDPRVVELVLQESKRILRMQRGILITETHHGFVCANSGVDQSNTPPGTAVLLPRDPDASARAIRAQLEHALGVAPAVVICDTFGRPWRLGQTNVAIGVAGINPFTDYRGSKDRFANELRVTQIATADELAGAAELVMAKADEIPVVLIRGLRIVKRTGSAQDLLRDPAQDLFR